MIFPEVLNRYLQRRSGKVMFNILCSLLAKSGALLISFFLVRLTVDYLSPAEYGVWMTLSSIVAWVTYCDIGLANGLRNKLTEALSVHDWKLAREYVSTGYFCILAIGLLLGAVMLGVSPFFSWNRILNVAEGTIPGCNQFAFLIFLFFTLTFVLRTTGTVFTAFQYPMVNDLIQLVINLLIAAGILLLKHKLPGGSIKPVGYVYILIPLMVWLLVYPLTFWGRFRAMRPNFRCFRRRHLASLLGLSGKFFLLQIICLVLFSSVNLIISHLCGNEAVAQYNIAFKYFSLLTFVFTIVLTPYWSAMTEAYVKQDFSWIRRQMTRLIAVWGLCMVFNLLMLAAAPMVYRLWIGGKIQVSFVLSFSLFWYVFISTWNNIFATFINGISMIKLQICAAVWGIIIFFPLCWYLSGFWGSAGIVWSVNISLLGAGVVLPLQCWKIVNNTATGIWRG